MGHRRSLPGFPFSTSDFLRRGVEPFSQRREQRGQACGRQSGIDGPAARYRRPAESTARGDHALQLVLLGAPDEDGADWVPPVETPLQELQPLIAR